jgi:hypothetical protein
MLLHPGWKDCKCTSRIVSGTVRENFWKNCAEEDEKTVGMG